MDEGEFFMLRVFSQQYEVTDEQGNVVEPVWSYNLYDLTISSEDIYDQAASDPVLYTTTPDMDGDGQPDLLTVAIPTAGDPPNQLSRQLVDTDGDGVADAEVVYMANFEFVRDPSTFEVLYLLPQRQAGLVPGSEPAPEDIEAHWRQIMFGERLDSLSGFNEWFTIDPATGAMTVIGEDGPDRDPVVYRITALESHPLTGMIYAAAVHTAGPDRESTLLRVDPNTGRVESLGPLGLGMGLGELGGLAFAPPPEFTPDPENPAADLDFTRPEFWTLYGVTNTGISGGLLVTIDTSSGLATPVGPTGFRELAGLDYDPATDRLYSVLSPTEPQGQPYALVALERATGAYDQNGVLGSQPVLATMTVLDPNAPVPVVQFAPVELTGLTVRPWQFGNDTAGSTDLGPVLEFSQDGLTLPIDDHDWYRFTVQQGGRVE
ncbi:MAG TPA: hypothetical protein EYP14_08620, partial [Planctomycetaceae bacterium]|nr:hypothetical protein [Planctomycetaceae bacterium]